MKRNILFAVLFVIIFSYFFTTSVNFSFATDSAKVQFEKSLNKTGSEAGYKPDKEANKNFSAFIGTILGYLLTFLGVIFLCLVIYGGYIWMTARGNEQEVEKAKNILKNVIIGLIIILAAYAIVYGFNTYIGSSIIQPVAY
jgi:magnesium-transporting ATPase (P-type)